MIFLASDHGGWQLKQFVKQILTELGEKFEDVGCDNENSCDYPDFAHALAERINAVPNSLGIALCGSGIGISIALNRHAGIRAARCRDTEDARLSRLHNDANILVLAGRQTDETTTKTMIETFLTTKFEGGRHIARVQKIELPTAAK